MDNQETLKYVKEKAMLWLTPSFDKETREEVKYLLEHDEKELIESFYTNLEFGTGGLRGVMGPGTNRINIYTISMATQGLCNYLKKEFSEMKEIKVVIGHDSRNNSRLYAETTADVFSANGIIAYLFDDLRPTPEISFAIRHYKCQSGVVITASHNPREYNGYKAYWDDGGQITWPHDTNIIGEVLKIHSIKEVRTGRNSSLIIPIGQETDDIYLSKITELSVNPEIVKKNHDLRIVFTPIHGSATKLVPMALQRFGFTNIYSVPEQDSPDGNFPTVSSPNPEEPAALELALKKAQEVDAELVMATDPDGDRVGVAVKDKTGKLSLLNGNQVASVLVYYLLASWSEKKKLKGKEYICKTIVTSDLLNVIAEKYGVKCFDVLTGFKYIARTIRENEDKLTFIVGGEESYGYLAGDFVRDKDAVSACALISEIAAWASEQGKTFFDILTDIYLEFGFYKESLISIVRKGKAGTEEIKNMMIRFRTDPPDMIGKSKVVRINDYKTGISSNLLSRTKMSIQLPPSDVLQFFLDDGSKISVRPSGTEPKIKFYFSVHENLDKIENLEKVNNLLEKRITDFQHKLELI